jgi:hypothetical protein
MLDLIPVSPAVALLEQVARLGEISDDAKGRALGHLESGCDITKPRVGMSCDEQNGSCVVGEEAPVCHRTSKSTNERVC